MMIARTAVALALFTFVGCAAPEGQDALGSAESEARSLAPGAGLGSAYADPAKKYLSSRALAPLHDVAAVDDATFALGERLRQIAPEQRELSLSRLLSAEKDPNAVRLVSSEKALLPKLWAAFEVDAAEEKIEIARLEARMKDKRIAHTPLAPNAATAIASLPAAHRLVAERIELADDADGDPSTICVADVRAVIASPAGFTADEARTFVAILDVLAAAQGTSPGRVIREVPEPGRHDRDVTTVGPVAVRLRENVRFVETRKTAADEWFPITLAPEAVADGFVLAKPENANVVVTRLEADAGGSFVAPADKPFAFAYQGSDSVVTSSQPVLVEVFSAGARIASKLVSTSYVSKRDKAVEMAPGTELVTPAGITLARALETSTRFTNGDAVVTWTYEVDPASPKSQLADKPRALSDADIAKLAPAPVKLALGTYDVPVPGFGTITFDVYANNLLVLSEGGATQTMYLKQREWRTPVYAKHGGASPFIHYDAATGELRVRSYTASSTTPWTTVVVDARHRR